MGNRMTRKGIPRYVSLHNRCCLRNLLGFQMFLSLQNPEEEEEEDEESRRRSRRRREPQSLRHSICNLVLFETLSTFSPLSLRLTFSFFPLLERLLEDQHRYCKRYQRNVDRSTYCFQPDSAQHWWRRSSSSSSSTLETELEKLCRPFDKELGVFGSFELSLQHCATVDCSTTMVVDLLGCSSRWQEAMCYFKLL